MKTLQMTASAVALGALALSAGADTTAAWWSLDFNNITTSWTDNEWEISGVGSFNRSSEEDASAVVDSYKDEALESKALELNTNGGDLVFAPEGERPDSGEGLVVDADVFFIASEQDPTITEVTGKPVQAALYLYSNPDSGDDPEFRAYSYGTSGNEWVPLSFSIAAEEDVGSGIWRHVQITYVGNNVTYKIGAKGADLSSVSGETISRANSNVAGSFHEVVFKGTGLVDNFVGQSLTVETINYHYLASVVGGSGLEVAEAEVEGNTATFSIPLTDGDSSPLTRIEVIGVNGTVTRTITVVVDLDTQTGTFTEDGVDTQVEDYDGFDVDITAFIGSGEPDETPFTILNLYYESSTPPEEYYDTGDEAAFTAELTTALQAAEAPITFDPAEGFTVSFSAPISGTYVLVAAPTPDADFDTETGDGEAVGTPATVEAGETVELSDDATVGSNAPAARFYKIKLVDGVKPAANAGE